MSARGALLLFICVTAYAELVMDLGLFVESRRSTPMTPQTR